MALVRPSGCLALAHPVVGATALASPSFPKLVSHVYAKPGAVLFIVPCPAITLAMGSWKAGSLGPIVNSLLELFHLSCDILD